MSRPIVLGAGPAGSTAALLLARAGAQPILIDRDASVGDAICGGFLSWKTAAALRALGVDPRALGAREVTGLKIFAGERQAAIPLPRIAYGLSRHKLDSELRLLAVEAGAELHIDRARSVAPGRIEGEGQRWESPAMFLATGKHDVRGAARARQGDDLALGLRVRLPPSPALEKLVGQSIELHLFRGGYAGVVLREGGTGNVCLAVRKSALADAGGDPWKLLSGLATHNPRFAERLGWAEVQPAVDTIGAVPYGWIARHTERGIFRLGDQAAVIPSLAGEGMAIALASGRSAAQGYLRGESAEAYQRRFASQVAMPVRVTEKLWQMAESPRGASAMTMLARVFPALAGMAMRWSRV